MTPEPMITIADAARRAGVHPRTMRRWIAEGTIAGYRVGPRLLRVRAADIAQLLTRGAQ